MGLKHISLCTGVRLKSDGFLIYGSLICVRCMHDVLLASRMLYWVLLKECGCQPSQLMCEVRMVPLGSAYFPGKPCIASW
jgi:hypothetical protein